MRFAIAGPGGAILAAFLSLQGCSPSARHPMVQRDVDQCIAGLVNVIPDAKAWQEACECASDAIQADRLYGGVRDAAYEDAHARKVQACGASGFQSKDDPFGILGNDAAPGDAEPAIDSPEYTEPLSESGELSDDHASETE